MSPIIQSPADTTDVIQKQITGDSLYLVLAPIGKSGMAIVGDTGQFVTMGKKRVTAFTDRGAARVTIAFAAGETSRTITGYASAAPIVLAMDGSSVGPVAYDDTTHLFKVTVTGGTNHSATIRIQEPLVSGGPRGERGAQRRTGIR